LHFILKKDLKNIYKEWGKSRVQEIFMDKNRSNSKYPPVCTERVKLDTSTSLTQPVTFNQFSIR